MRCDSLVRVFLILALTVGGFACAKQTVPPQPGFGAGTGGPSEGLGTGGPGGPGGAGLEAGQADAQGLDRAEGLCGVRVQRRQGRRARGEGLTLNL